MRIAANGMTVGERLFVDRRRKKMTQADYAATLGMKPRRYQQVESGAIEDKEVTAPKVSKLTPTEECILLRRRHGMTQKDLAEKMQISRYWLILMEREEKPNQALLDHWDVN